MSATPAPVPQVDPVTERAHALLVARLPGVVLAAELAGRHPWIRVTVGGLRDALRLLRDDATTQLECCHLISGVDWPARKPGETAEMEVVYHLVSYSLPYDADYKARRGLLAKNDPWVAVKVRVPREAPEVPSVMDLFTGADWHERETYDLLGVRFTGRGFVPRILLPEDWPGFPLRKDWETPTDYHGIPIVPPEGL
jgi:NADH-quinone oxidoreductase subunit C